MRLINRRKRFSFSWLSVVPALVLFTTFTYLPLVFTLTYSFTDWNGYSRKFNLVGIANFINLFKDGEVMLAFFNTLYLAVFCFLIALVMQMLLAVILFEGVKGKSVALAIIYLPCVLSQMIVSMTWLNILQGGGILNALLRSFGMAGMAKDWLGDPAIVKNVIVFLNTWQWTGYGMVIIMAGLSAIPSEVNESATLEGAHGFGKFFRITLPLIMPSLTVISFIGITGSLKMFDLPFILTNGGPVNASLTMSMVIYNYAFSYEKFGMSSSIGLVFFALIALLTIAQLGLTRRLEVEE